MSIPVEPADLADTMAGFTSAYLLTASADGLVKAVSVRATHVDGAVRVPAPGRGSLANLAANPVATLLLPPVTTGELTLLVDGAAAVAGEDVVLTPTSAILHRAAVTP